MIVLPGAVASMSKSALALVSVSGMLTNPMHPLKNIVSASCIYGDQACIVFGPIEMPVSFNVISSSWVYVNRVYVSLLSGKTSAT